MHTRLLALALAAVGCGSVESDLLDALPRVEDLTFDLPAAGSSKPAVGETARLYLVTHRTTSRLNGMIGEAV